MKDNYAGSILPFVCDIVMQNNPLFWAYYLPRLGGQICTSTFYHLKYTEPYLLILKMSHITPVHRYRKHSSRPRTYRSLVRTHTKSGYSILTVQSNKVQARAAETCGLHGLVRLEPKLMGAIKSGRNWLNSKMCKFRELPSANKSLK